MEKRFGDFEIIEEIGKGGMGKVFRARQISLNRDVAIKILPSELSSNDEFVQRFDLEAKSVASLIHQNILQMYSKGVTDEGIHYFAMEYVEGEDIAAKIRGGNRFAEAEAIDIIIQACCGLESAWKQNIIHRDIKPGNIMITKDGTVKIADFGLVKSLEATNKLTMADVFMGTVAYTSPEQGEGKPLDHRTDIYSLGIVFYQLLTNKVPFEGETPSSIIYKHVHVPPVPVKEINPELSPEVEQIVMKAIAKKTEDRFQNVVEFRQALEDLKMRHFDRKSGPFMADEADTVQAGINFKNKEVPATRNKSFMMAIVLLLVLLCGALLYAFLGRDSGKRPLSETKKESVSVESKPVHTDHAAESTPSIPELSKTNNKDAVSTDASMINRRADRVVSPGVPGGTVSLKAQQAVFTGMADGTTDQARGHAIDAALRHAVKQGMAVFVSSKTLVENNILVEDKIYSETRGYIKNYEILQEGASEGAYKVKVTAQVELEKLAEDLEALGLLIRKKQNPRVLVIVRSKEVIGSVFEPSREGNRNLENQIEGDLAGKGFQIVDAGQVNHKKKVAAALSGDNMSGAGKIAKDFGAEMLIIGDVRREYIETKHLYGMKVRFFSNEVRLKAVETETAKVLYSGYRTKPPSGVSHLDPLEEASSELLEEMVTGIIQQWSRDVYQIASYELNISGALYEDLSSLKQGLETVQGFGGIQTRSFESGRAVLEVHYNGSLEELADTLRKLQEPSLEIVGLRSNSLDMKIVK